jgi:hypothetical protein
MPCVLCLLLGRLHQRYKRIQIVADELLLVCYLWVPTFLNPVEQLWLNIKQRYLSNMAFKDYEEIVNP